MGKKETKEIIYGTDRNWAFTSWIEPKFNPETTAGLLYGYETCPTTGKKHYQGYIEFKNPKRYKEVKRIIGDPEVHLGRRIGTRKQIEIYCTKTDNYAVFGSLSNSITKLKRQLETERLERLKEQEEDQRAINRAIQNASGFYYLRDNGEV